MWAFAACEFGVAPAELVGLLAQGDALPLGCEYVLLYGLFSLQSFSLVLYHSLSA